MIADGWEQKDGLWLLQRALFATQFGVMITDAAEPDDPIVWVNGSFEKITGYTAEEVVGRNPRFLQAGDGDQPALDELRNARGANNDDIEWTGVLRNYRKDGTPFRNELVAAVVRDGRGRVTHHIGVITDVTGREEAGERLRFQAELLDAVGQAVVAVDLSGRVTYWNRAAEVLYGWTAGEAVGRRADEVLVSEEQRGRAEEVWAELAAGRSWSGEFVVGRKDGTSFPAAVTNTPVFDERGALVGVIGVSADVTERKLTEQAMRDAERKYRVLVESIPAITYVQEAGGDRRVTYVSPQVEAVMGHRPEEETADPGFWVERLHPDDRERVLAEERRAGEAFGVEYRQIARDGRVVWLRDEAVLVRDEEGNPSYWQGFVQDVTERREAEEALRESEERHRAVVEQTAEGIFLLDVDTRRVLEANAAFSRLLGYAPGELYGMAALDFVTQSREELEDNVRRTLREGRRFVGERRYRRKDGSAVDVEVNVSVISYGGREVICAAVRDVTERRRAGEALRQSEERFRALAQNASDVVALVRSDGSVGYVSPSIGRILGHAPEGRLGKGVFELVHPDDVAWLRGVFADLALRGLGASAKGEFRMRHADGSYRHVEAVGTNLIDDAAVGGVVINYRDVTERKEAEKRLRESEERFRTVVESLGEGLLITDPRNVVVYANPRLAELTGYAVEELVGRPAHELLLPPEAWEEAVGRNDDRLRRETSDLHELELARKDGTTFWAEVSATPYRDTGGRIVGSLRAITDVTERREAEEALGRSRANLAAAQRIANVGSWEYDRRTGQERWSDEMYRVLGLATRSTAPSVETLVGFTHPDDRQALREHGAGRPAHGEWDEIEYRVVRPDGEVRFVYDRREVERDQLSGEAVRVVGTVQDVTERREAEEALRKSEERFRSLVRHASDTIAILAADGTILYESPSVERMVGYAPEELVGTNAFSHVHPDDRERAAGVFADVLGDPAAGAVPTSVGLRFRHKDGSYRHLEVVGTNLLHEPAVGGIVLNTRDVTERKELEESLRHRALHDPLTGLPNRALFADRLGHAVARAYRRGEPVAVLFMDLDNFKVVNDSLGHDTGDDLLWAAAKRLEGCLRPGDTLARLGGDEFVALLEEVDGVGGATEVAERLLGALEEPFAIGGHEVFVTASVGVSLSASQGVGGEGRTEQDLLRDADAAMYRAKAKGKAGYEVFDPLMYEEALERLRLEGDLRRAMERGELAVHYQPLVRLTTGRVVGVEALLRWEHPKRGLVPPASFVPLAEETGLIVPLGRWVLGEACRQARRWRDENLEEAPVEVGVNLSAKQFLNPGLVGDVARVLEETELDPSALVLEVTESVLVEDVAGSVAVLGGLKGLGVKVAMDDFGAGYSSLSRLADLPADYLKIDRGIVEGFKRDPEKNEAIASAAIGLAHAVGAKAVAEGVETPGQLRRLREMGCDLVQGYLFGEPRGPGGWAPPGRPRDLTG